MARLTIETEWSDGRELVPSVESKMAAAQLFFGELICFSFSCCLPEIFHKIQIICLCSPNNFFEIWNLCKALTFIIYFAMFIKSVLSGEFSKMADGFS